MGAVAAVAQLRAPARRFDRAKAKVAALPSQEKAKAQFDEAARRAQQNPTPDNLAALNKAIKDLSSGSPRRVKLEQELGAADVQLRQALTALAGTLRGMLPKAEEL